MVKNTQGVQDWFLPGAKYKALFTRDVIGSTPPFNDSGLITCNKWHVRGFCYKKCTRKGSHKKFESNAHKTAYGTWVKALKAKAPWQLGPTGDEENKSSVSYDKINIATLLYPGCADSSVPTFSCFDDNGPRTSLPRSGNSSQAKNYDEITKRIPPRILKPIAGLPSQQDKIIEKFTGEHLHPTPHPSLQNSFVETLLPCNQISPVHLSGKWLFKNFSKMYSDTLFKYSQINIHQIQKFALTSTYRDPGMVSSTNKNNHWYKNRSSISSSSQVRSVWRSSDS